MKEDLNCLKDWLQGNKLSLNVLKIHAVVVGPRPNLMRKFDEVSDQLSFSIDGTQIETVKRTKYLGVQFDSHLVWDEHIKCMRTEFSQALEDRLSKLCRGTVELQLSFVTQYWDVAANIELISFKNCKIELTELL